MTPECHHGQLRRSCELCEKDEEIARLSNALKQAEARASRIFDVLTTKEAILALLMRALAHYATRTYDSNYEEDGQIQFAANQAIDAARGLSPPVFCSD